MICGLGLHREAKSWLEGAQNHLGSPVTFQQVDVTSWKQLEAPFEAFHSQFGGAPEMFDINLVHPIKFSRISIRRMQQTRSSCIILHISSIMAQEPNVVLPLYATSKAGLTQFIRCMAPLEKMCAIRVVGVVPG